MAVDPPSSHKAPRGLVVSIWETLKEMIWFEKEQKQNNNLISFLVTRIVKQKEKLSEIFFAKKWCADCWSGGTRNQVIRSSP